MADVAARAATPVNPGLQIVMACICYTNMREEDTRFI